MKVIAYNPDPAVEDARNFVNEAFRKVPWDVFQQDIEWLSCHGIISPDIVEDIRKFMKGSLRCLFWGIKLSPVEYLQAARVLEAACDAAFGPLES